jgi:hypothetical protein
VAFDEDATRRRTAFGLVIQVERSAKAEYVGRCGFVRSGCLTEVGEELLEFGVALELLAGEHATELGVQ